MSERVEIITIWLTPPWTVDDCPMCEHERVLDHVVGWYCGPTRLDLGAKLANGDEVGGRCVCRRCHDQFYEVGVPT
jgi:hypothetical protein